jgi:uncharacterized protein YxeA
MEHMKRFLMILVAVVAAGAAFMYVRNMMMERKGDNVKIQAYSSSGNTASTRQKIAGKQGGDTPQEFA